MKIRLDRKKLETATVIIALGIALRIALVDYPNIEPILPLALLAGIILGGWYALWVPLTMMVLSDLVIYTLGAGGSLGWNFIMGVTFFTWSGMMLAGYAGKALRPRMFLRMRNMAVFTSVGIGIVLIYDAWTMIGIWLVGSHSFELVLAGQVTFTIYHLLSTLIFVPLFGTGYVYIKEYGMPLLTDWKSEHKNPGDEA
ncbi:MAG: hypothetical protein KKH41_03525 [Candidatus Thermoplasmatota archaeon]|nr:hypothetical protein [Euryarchaeota archaeon]MBU4032369.1 hypothetical protein [Candidatus Thermoplasmatota archaeon]MBU4070802.1 hypothetical protein [Candidatus Thermoplasmatota archaeon]MBU4144794.1 hypothetical protein [Candidatus Thermoplasmatota archaeon]MBU4591636.1 hypothetical protein [Candidatus Thermoplasmatota archaeon]